MNTKRLEKEIEILDEKIKSKKLEQEEISSMISKFEGLENKILKMRYIDGLTLKEIASETGYTYQWIKEKHAEAIRMIKFSKK